MTGQIKQIIGLVVNPRKENISPILESFNTWADKHTDIKFLLCTFNSSYVKKNFSNLKQSTEKNLLKKSELIITLGGDGTLLRTVNKLNDTSVNVLGVNLGGLGFLANTPPDKLINHIENYLRGHYVIDERTMLCCNIKDYNKKFIALNDIVIDKAGFSRVIQIDVKADGSLLNSYIADGLIVSTPTGSTGYSLSAGGPIVSPHTNVFVLNPICPHSLTNRPLIIDDNNEIIVQVWTESGSFNLFRDGENKGSFPSGTSFHIKKSNQKVRFIQNKSQNFFKILSKKLSWGGDFRNKKRWTYQKENNLKK